MTLETKRHHNPPSGQRLNHSGNGQKNMNNKCWSNCMRMQLIKIKPNRQTYNSLWLGFGYRVRVWL